MGNKLEDLDFSKNWTHPENKEQQPELPGMPEKETQVIMAEEIVDVKEDMKDLKERLDGMKTRLINEMRVKQVNDVRVKGFVFHLDIKDSLKITADKGSKK